MSKKAEIDVDVERNEKGGPDIHPIKPVKGERREDGVQDVPEPREGQAEVYERRERGASGEPAPQDYSAGEYHGLTPQQIKKIEDARYDDTDNVTTVDGAGSQAEEQQLILDKQEKEEQARMAKEKAEWEKADRDRKTKEKADHDEREKEANYGKKSK